MPERGNPLINILLEVLRPFLTRSCCVSVAHGIEECLEYTLPMHLMFRVPSNCKRAMEHYTKTIVELYRMLGMEFLHKFAQEDVQYRALQACLNAKLAEMKYFFRHDRSSRKVTVSSTDCISFIQAYKSKLMVTMRSSDVLKLLPCDIFGLWHMAQQTACWNGGEVYLTLNVPHVYEKDMMNVQMIVNYLEERNNAYDAELAGEGSQDKHPEGACGNSCSEKTSEGCPCQTDSGPRDLRVELEERLDCRDSAQ